MGSLDYPVCSICKERHALLDGHKWTADKAAQKPQEAKLAPVIPSKPITTAQLTKKLTDSLPPAEAKELQAVVAGIEDRRAHRQAQVRAAVARHRAKKKAEQPVSGNQ